jgi:hypothetical protein
LEKNHQDERKNVQMPKSLIAVQSMKEDSLVPDAMPLIRRISLLNTKEPDFYNKVRRTQTMNAGHQDFKDICQHDEKIENWKCDLCK